MRVAPETPAPAESANTNSAQTQASPPSPRAPQPVVTEIDTRRIRERSRKDNGDTSAAATNSLADAINSPGSFKNWTKPEHGPSLSVSQVREVNDRTRVFVVAVRNTATAPLRLVPGAPDLFVQTFDSKWKPLQVEQLKKLRVETTTMNGAIPAGATVYYAVVYETPILGTSQRLRVGLAQIEAADAPSTAELSSTSK